MTRTFSLSWTAPTDDGGSPITGHDVGYRPAGGSETVVATGSTGSTYNLTNLTTGTEYTVRVRAENAIGKGDWSSTVIKLAALPPLEPASPTATEGNTVVDLAWTAPTSDVAITGYSVEYTPGGGSASTVLTGSTSTSYQLTGLTNGTTYSIRIAGISAAGTGDYSVIVNATPTAPTSSSSQGSTSSSSQGPTSSSSQGSTGGITPNTDASARFYLPASATAFQVGAATTTGYYRITDGTTTSAVTGASYYAATSQYWYAYYGQASLSGMSSSANKTIELYSCDAAGNKSGSLVFVNLAANSSAVEAVDLSGLSLVGASAFTSTAYGSAAFKYSMSGGSSSLPSSITEMRAVGTTFGQSPVNTYSGYYYGQGLDIAGQNLDAAQLDQLYADLATVAAGTLVVRGNPGTSNDTPSIASAKGYTVYGT